MKEDEHFCNWFAVNYPDKYKFYRTAWIVAGKPNV